MDADLTYELVIDFKHSSIELREAVKSYLDMNGFSEFSEGYIDVDHIDDPNPDNFSAQLSQQQISIYRFEKKPLEELSRSLLNLFTGSIKTDIKIIQTVDWRDKWRDSFKPIDTQKFYLRPPWEKPSDDNNKIDLIIEPAMAFGTGQHATTRLCLRLIEKNFDLIKGQRVLDLGTGTGVLSIAAAKLGAKKILATDIDSDAVLATNFNKELNNVEFQVEEEPYPKQEEYYSWVIANILAVTIIDMMEEIVSFCRPGGNIILSGILLEQEELIETKALKFGLNLVDLLQEDDWIALHYKKP